MNSKILMTIAVVALVGCSKDDDPKKQLGDACTVDADCASGLVCRGSVCVASDVTDMGTEDTTVDTTNNVNNLNNVVPEDYIITYVLEVDNNRELMAYDTTSGEHSKVHPDSVSCNLGCWASKDLNWFIFAQQNGENFDILKMPMSGLVASGTPETVISAVRRAEVQENLLTYVKREGETNIAYYTDLNGGSETLIGSIGTVQSTEGDWFVDPISSTAVLYDVTLQTLNIKVGDLGTEVTDTAFTIDSSNFQEQSGSFFGGDIATAISPDGKRMALVTQSAPMNYAACDNDSMCTDGVARFCGRLDRCTAIELVAHFVDLEKLDNLGTACSADDVCGPVHTCDIPAEDQVDQAVCIPRRVVLGLPGQQTQGNPQATGCELTDGNDGFFYSELRAPISFDPDNNLYFVGARECDNAFDSAVVRLSPTSDNIQSVFGLNGGYVPDDCYDPVESKIVVENCSPYIQQALVSPGGNDLIFIGTNPNVADPSLSRSNLDLWSVKRNGEDRTWVGEHPELSRVKTINVHKQP